MRLEEELQRKICQLESSEAQRRKLLRERDTLQDNLELQEQRVELAFLRAYHQRLEYKSGAVNTSVGTSAEDDGEPNEEEEEETERAETTRLIAAYVISEDQYYQSTQHHEVYNTGARATTCCVSVASETTWATPVSPSSLVTGPGRDTSDRPCR